MSQFGNLGDKAKDLAAEHPEQVEEFSDQASEKGGNALDEATGGRFGDQIDKGEKLADERIGQSGDGEQDAEQPQ